MKLNYQMSTKKHQYRNLGDRIGIVNVLVKIPVYQLNKHLQAVSEGPTSTPYTSIHLKIGTNRKQVAPPKVPNTLSVLRFLRFCMEFCGDFPNEGHIFPPTLGSSVLVCSSTGGTCRVVRCNIQNNFFFLCTLYTTVHFQTNSHLFHNLSFLPSSSK